MKFVFGDSEVVVRLMFAEPKLMIFAAPVKWRFVFFGVWVMIFCVFSAFMRDLHWVPPLVNDGGGTAAITESSTAVGNSNSAHNNQNDCKYGVSLRRYCFLLAIILVVAFFELT